MRPSAVAALLAFAAALAAAPPARAQTSPPAAAEDGTRRHFHAGVSLFEDQNFEAALVEFEAARATSHEPVILYNIGLCQRALFRYTDAIATFGTYLDETAGNPRVSSAQRSEVTAAIAEMTALLADVTIALQPPSAVESSAVTVDGRATTARSLKLAAGRHVVEASARGFEPARREIIVVAGVAQSVALTLEAVPPPSPPAAPIPSPAATRLEAGPTTLAAAPPAATPSPFYATWWFWTAVGVVVAGGVTATILATRSHGPELVSGTLGGKEIMP